MKQDLSLARATYAHKCIDARFVKKSEDLVKYSTVVMGAVPLMRQCGLLQVAAFWAAKQDAKRDVLDDVLGWLSDQQSVRTARLCTSLPTTKASTSAAHAVHHQALGALVKLKSRELALLQEEAEAVLEWLKRFAEGLDDKPKEPESEESTSVAGKRHG